MSDPIVESMTHLPPLARFAVALMIFLCVPALCKRVRLPAVVELLAAGVFIGPSGMQIAPKNGEVVEAFFVTIGLLIDVHIFIDTIVHHLGLVCGIVATPILAKWIVVVTSILGPVLTELIGKRMAAKK